MDEYFTNQILNFKVAWTQLPFLWVSGCKLKFNQLVCFWISDLQFDSYQSWVILAYHMTSHDLNLENNIWQNSCIFWTFYSKLLYNFLSYCRIAEQEEAGSLPLCLYFNLELFQRQSKCLACAFFSCHTNLDIYVFHCVLVVKRVIDILGKTFILITEISPHQSQL